MTYEINEIYDRESCCTRSPFVTNDVYVIATDVATIVIKISNYCTIIIHQFAIPTLLRLEMDSLLLVSRLIAGMNTVRFER